MTDLITQHRLSNDIKKYLKGLDEQDLREKVRLYFDQDRSSWDFQTRLDELAKVLEVPGTRSYSHFVSNRTLPGGTIVYRARIIDQLDEIKSKKDVINPPSARTKAGRLNRSGNSLLYTALTPTTAAHEVGAYAGRLVAMATFQMVPNMNVTDLHPGIYGKDLPMRLQSKADVIMDFIERHISQRDRPAHLPDYAETEFIVNTLYTGPDEFSSGWLYPSYADPTTNGLNICFRPEHSLLKLRLVSVSIDMIMGINSDGTFHIRNLRNLQPDAQWNLTPIR